MTNSGSSANLLAVSLLLNLLTKKRLKKGGYNSSSLLVYFVKKIVS